MTLGVRAKLFIVSVLLMVGAGTVSGVFLEYSLRTWLNRRAEAELWRQTRTARDIVELAPGINTTQALNALAWRLSDSIGARITIMDTNGTVLAESQITNGHVEAIENHADRYEINEALKKVGYGLSKRLSKTLGSEMLYAALPFARANIHGIIRVGSSTEQVELAVYKLRVILLAAGIVGLGVTLFIGALSSHLASRALRHLVRHAEKVARGDLERRVAWWPEDEIGGLAGSFYEIADKLERTVNTLGRERDQIAAILESMSEAVVSLDHDQRITLVNGAAIELLGTCTRPFGSTLMQSVEHEALQKLFEHVKTGVAAHDEFLINNRRVLARATPLSYSGGSVIVMVDITFTRQVETMHRDFVANVSHELRTPVSIICANTETLLNGALNDAEVARPFVEALSRHAERLKGIIANLLALAQAEAGQLRLKSSPVALNSVARRAVELLQDRAQKKNVEVRVSIGEGLIGLGDAQALDQVLLNLLENALKYTPANGCVTVRAWSRGQNVRVEIVDNGPGLLLEHRQRIFERFYRVDTGRSRDVGGTGLGLSIVKHLCETMGGKVGVDAAEPCGSIFWFTLPVAAQIAA